MADNINRKTTRAPGEGQDEESLAEREARYKLRDEQRRLEKAERQRKGIE